MQKDRHQVEITFFVLGDTHFGYEQNFPGNDLRSDIIDQMNNLPGWPYPKEIGGIVDKPCFVLFCGDMLDGLKKDEGKLEFLYYLYYSKRLMFPQYEVIGNHDLTPEFINYFLNKHGAKSYSFDIEGVHLISLNSVYDENEVAHFEEDDIDFLHRDLDGIEHELPVVLFTHSRLDRATNGGDILEILKANRVILIISAHLHKPDIFQLKGIPCIDIGHCRRHPTDPVYGNNFYVVNISGRNIFALPWRWDLKEWECGQKWGDPALIEKPFRLITTF